MTLYLISIKQERGNIMLLYIPFILSILCGIFNPYAGPLGIVATIFGMLLIFFMEKSIKKEILKMKANKDDKAKVITELLVNNWIMTAFAFLMMNVVINIFLFYLCNLSLSISGNAPIYGGITIFADNINICYLLFVLTVIFNAIGTIIVFVKGNKLKKIEFEQIIDKPKESVEENNKNADESSKHTKCDDEISESDTDEKDMILQEDNTKQEDLELDM